MSRTVWWTCCDCECEFEDKDWMDITCPECSSSHTVQQDPDRDE